MSGALVLDTGAFVALLDRSAERHHDCVARLAEWQGLVATTEAVLAETLQLVGSTRRAQLACLEFFLRGAFALVPSSPQSLRRAATLMERNSDVPMDFADATLVALAEELGTEQVFTLNRRRFAAYRWRRSSFTIIP